MRAIVMSDIHGHADALRWLLQQAWQQVGPVDAYICLGDGVSDFYRVENFIRARDAHAAFYAVRGNCDYAVGDMPEMMTISFGGAQVLLTHGHLYQVKSTKTYLRDAARRHGYSIVLYGHTHQPDMDTSMPLLINPGAACDSRLAVLEVNEGKPRVRLLDLS